MDSKIVEEKMPLDNYKKIVTKFLSFKLFRADLEPRGLPRITQARGFKIIAT